MNRERMTYLLETFMDVRCTLQRNSEAGDDAEDPSRLLQMPVEWERGGYSKLERCLRTLRCVDRDLYWHVAARYLRAERRTRLCNYSIKDGDVVLDLAKAPGEHVVDFKLIPDARKQLVRLVTWDARVDAAKARAAVDWLIRAYGVAARLERERGVNSSRIGRSGCTAGAIRACDEVACMTAPTPSSQNEGGALIAPRPVPVS